MDSAKEPAENRSKEPTIFSEVDPWHNQTGPIRKLSKSARKRQNKKWNKLMAKHIPEAVRNNPNGYGIWANTLDDTPAKTPPVKENVEMSIDAGSDTHSPLTNTPTDLSASTTHTIIDSVALTRMLVTLRTVFTQPTETPEEHQSWMKEQQKLYAERVDFNETYFPGYKHSTDSGYRIYLPSPNNREKVITVYDLLCLSNPTLLTDWTHIVEYMLQNIYYKSSRVIDFNKIWMFVVDKPSSEVPDTSSNPLDLGSKWKDSRLCLSVTGQFARYNTWLLTVRLQHDHWALVVIENPSGVLESSSGRCSITILDPMGPNYNYHEKLIYASKKFLSVFYEKYSPKETFMADKIDSFVPIETAIFSKTSETVPVMLYLVEKLLRYPKPFTWNKLIEDAKLASPNLRKEIFEEIVSNANESLTSFIRQRESLVFNFE